MQEPEPERQEPWLRATLAEVPAVPRAVLHALALADENVRHWTPLLTDGEIHAQPFGLTPYAFHVRHIAHSLDRLLTYAEGLPLNVIQRGALRVELEPGMSREAMLAEFGTALREAEGRIRALPLNGIPDALPNARTDTHPNTPPNAFLGALESPRVVGAKRLPTTLGGLLVHLADHTQRHAGQAVTTAKLLLALRER